MEGRKKLREQQREPNNREKKSSCYWLKTVFCALRHGKKNKKLISNKRVFLLEIDNLHPSPSIHLGWKICCRWGKSQVLGAFRLFDCHNKMET